MDYGKRYCHYSPSVEESVLHDAITTAIMSQAKQNADVLRVMKMHIGMGLEADDSEDKSLDIQIRIAEIDAEFKTLLQNVASETEFDEEKMTDLICEKRKLEKQLQQISDTVQKRENAKSRLDEIFTIIDGLKNHPMEYDDRLIRQILECVIVENKKRIKVVFVGGLEVEQEL